MHLYRWDLDKTYLATDIHSVRGMLRAAWEPAEDKRHVPGAPELLRGLLDTDPGARASIVSGSPRQLRAALERRLVLDGIRFDELVLKDNLHNLTHGRFRALRGQLGYKLPHLLALRLGAPADATETLFGDDAEVDALIYDVYAAILAGEVADDEVIDLMREGGAYDDQIEHAQRSLRRIHRGDRVHHIFIHVDRRLPLHHYALLGPRVRVVFSWLQAALALAAEERLSVDKAAEVVRACAAHQRLTPDQVAALVQDAARRMLAPEATILAVSGATDPPVDQAVRRAVDALGGHRDAPADPASKDWRAFLRAAAG